mmetsp:Transcript_29331/g.55410  ORF Transcript_29331/g.55410 Transcript_29331/m.55410 type:complete len:224 (-) Transcript_29331:121-792(-)
MQGPFPVPQHHLLPDSPAGVANILRLTGQAQALLAVVVHEAVRSDSSVDLLGLRGPYDVAEDDRESVALQVADVELAAPGDGLYPAPALAEAAPNLCVFIRLVPYLQEPLLVDLERNELVSDRVGVLHSRGAHRVDFRNVEFLLKRLEHVVVFQVNLRHKADEGRARDLHRLPLLLDDLLLAGLVLGLLLALEPLVLVDPQLDTPVPFLVLRSRVPQKLAQIV